MSVNPLVPTVVILNYHRVSENTGTESLFSIQPETLREHLRILQEYKVVVDHTLIDGTFFPGGDFKVGLSFDDGNASDYEVVLPILNEFGLRASFFPVVNHVGRQNNCSWEQLKIMADKGFSIGSHGLNHDILLKLDPEQQKEEFIASKKIIEDKLGRKVTQFAFPFGRHDDQMLDLCREAGYAQALTTGLKVNKVRPDTFLLYRWNITSKTSTELFRQVISSSGVFSPALELTTKLNQLPGKNKD